MNHHDEQWARRVREVGAGVVPPNPADPGTMADVAIRRVRTRRSLLVAGSGAATAAVLAGSAFALGSPAPGTGQVAGPGAASSVSAAPTSTPSDTRGQAGDTPDVGWPDANYWHTTFEIADPGGEGEEKIRTQEQIWYGNDRPGAIVSIEGTESLPAGFDTPWAMTWDELYALPTSPDALEEKIRRHVGEPGSAGDPTAFGLPPNEQIVVMAAHLLFQAPSSPELRDAVWQVVTGLDDVEVSDGADAAGRPGTVAQLMWDGKPARTIIYDQDSRQPLESQINYSDGDASTFTLVESGPAGVLPPDVRDELDG